MMFWLDIKYCQMRLEKFSNFVAFSQYLNFNPFALLGRSAYFLSFFQDVVFVYNFSKYLRLLLFIRSKNYCSQKILPLLRIVRTQNEGSLISSYTYVGSNRMPLTDTEIEKSIYLNCWGLRDSSKKQLFKWQ